MNNQLEIQINNLLKSRPELSEIQAMNICLDVNLTTFKIDFRKRTTDYKLSKINA